MDETPTGVRIEDCDTCTRRHPVTRQHCSTCGLALLFRCARPDCGKASAISNSPGTPSEGDPT